MGRDDERKRALDWLAEHGWYVHHVSAKGYTHVRCGCGRHTGVLHKTPSNPNHFRQKAKFLVRQCSTAPR